MTRAAAGVPNGVVFEFMDRSGALCRVAVLGDVGNPLVCPTPQFAYCQHFAEYPYWSFAFAEPRAVELFGR